MEQNHQWNQHKITLLKQQLREVKESLAYEGQARKTLIEQHRQDRDQFLIDNGKDSSEWARLLVNQAAQLIALNSIHIEKRKIIIERHHQETLQLERRIELEKKGI